MREYYLKLNYYGGVGCNQSAIALHCTDTGIIAGMLLDGLTVDDIDGEAEGGGGETTPPPKSKPTKKRKEKEEEKKTWKKKKRRRRAAATKELGGEVKAGREGEEEGGEWWGDMWKMCHNNQFDTMQSFL